MCTSAHSCTHTCNLAHLKHTIHAQLQVARERRQTNVCVHETHTHTHTHTQTQLQVVREAADNVCTICHDTLMNPIRLRCGHIFCEDCVYEWLQREQT
jgi:hypothetical protein